MTFRQATLEDATTLYHWRLQDEQEPWWQGQPVTADQHRRWLTERINTPLVTILIWHENEQPAGTIRIDSNGELAYHATNPHAAVQMLTAARQYASRYGGRLKATVDQSDRTRIEQLRQAGFERYPTQFLAWRE